MKKKIIFILGGVTILLIGLISGAFLYGVYFKSAQSPGIKTEISPAQIEKITSLQPGQIFSGEVKSKEGNEIALTVQLIDYLELGEEKEITVKIPVDSKDEIVRFKKISAVAPDLELIKASFNDIKVGDYLSVKILNNKKIIYLPTQ